MGLCKVVLAYANRVCVGPGRWWSRRPVSANKCSIVKFLTSGVYGHEKCPVNTGHLIARRLADGLGITVNCNT